MEKKIRIVKKGIVDYILDGDAETVKIVGRKIDGIRDWIEGAMQDYNSKSVTAVSETFGTAVMEDGREAQIQVTLEMDKEEWKVRAGKACR